MEVSTRKKGEKNNITATSGLRFHEENRFPCSEASSNYIHNYIYNADRK